MFTRFSAACILKNSFRPYVFSKSFHSLLQPRSNVPLPNKRSFFSLFRSPTQTDLKKADDIPDSFVMIYRNAMSRYLLGAQIITLVTGGIVLVALMLKDPSLNYRRDTVEWSAVAVPSKHEEMYYITFFVILLVVIQTIVGRTPIRIYKVPKTSKYIAINYGNYFFGKERYDFLSSQIGHVKESGILPWRENRYLIRTETQHRPILLLEQYFRRPADLSIMLGEQKDPDLEETEEKK